MQRLLSFRKTLAPILLALSFTLTFGACNTLTSFFVSDAQETELGFQVSQQIESDYALLSETHAVTKWAKDLVGGMTAASEAFRVPERFDGYKVHVINDDQLVNAFAAPGGFIYITTGLILHSDTCAEVAGVIGHEMAHVTQRHSAQRLAKDAATIGLSDFLLKDGILKDLGQAAYAVAMETHFSQKDESEADRVGAEIMYHSGYNPYALADMFLILSAQEPDGRSKLASFFSSHPESKKRAAAIESQIESSWDDVQKDDGEQYTYDCIGTSPDTLEGVKALL